MRRLLMPCLLLAVSNLAQSAPQRFAPEALGQDGRISLTPAFSADGKTLYFAQSECATIGSCPQRLKTSSWNGERWTRPTPVPLEAPARVDWPSVSPDGRALLFSWSAPRADKAGLDIYEDFDLYRLDLAQGAIPRPLDSADINRPRAGAIRTTRFVHNETNPMLTDAGDLYFWTERCDGVGERDVYVAPADGRGGFRMARPLPPPINSTGRDTFGWISGDGLLMLLAYPDRGGMGEADLFAAVKQDGVWQTPVWLGERVNSAQADFGPRLSADRRYLLFSSTRPFDGVEPGLIQIWQIAVQEVPVLAGLLGRRSAISP